MLLRCCWYCPVAAAGRCQWASSSMLLFQVLWMFTRQQSSLTLLSLFSTNANADLADVLGAANLLTTCRQSAAAAAVLCCSFLWLLTPAPAGAGAASDPDMLQQLFTAAGGLCKVLAKPLAADITTTLKHTAGQPAPKGGG